MRSELEDALDAIGKSNEARIVRREVARLRTENAWMRYALEAIRENGDEFGNQADAALDKLAPRIWKEHTFVKGSEPAVCDECGRMKWAVIHSDFPAAAQ